MTTKPSSLSSTLTSFLAAARPPAWVYDFFIESCYMVPKATLSSLLTASEARVSVEPALRNKLVGFGGKPRHALTLHEDYLIDMHE